MSNIKNNILIAKFRGGKLSEDEKDIYFPEGYQHLSNVNVEDLKYDSSWDWLMSVVDKITSMKNISITYYSDNNRLVLCDMAHQIYDESKPKDTMMDVFYEAIIEFIKYKQEKNE